MEYITRYVDIIIMTYLTGLILSSMLYLPYRVARHKLKGNSLRFAVATCFVWPISLPLGITWSIIKCLLIFPIVTTFKFLVKSFSLPEKEKKLEEKKPEDERETVPFKLDPKFMNVVSEKNEKQSTDSRSNVRFRLD